MIAASVCTAGNVVPWSFASPPSDDDVTGRLSAEMMPLVTVLSRPNGEPIATTSWPTLRSAELPSVAGVRPGLVGGLDDREIGSTGRCR